MRRGLVKGEFFDPSTLFYIGFFRQGGSGAGSKYGLWRPQGGLLIGL